MGEEKEVGKEQKSIIRGKRREEREERKEKRREEIRGGQDAA
jgi:hypothetical protein